MASLLDLTVQGDVATITDESKLPQIKLMGPLELYRLWERQSWASHQIDLTRDRSDWESLAESERESMLWGLSAFFVGEERVTSQFSGLVMAAEDKHEEAFLLTQQVDEARHAQHFNRLYEEVIRGLSPARTPDLNDDYFTLFGPPGRCSSGAARRPEQHRAEGRLHHDLPHGDRGTLALTGQRFQTERIERRGILPGHLEAFKRIAQDEHRHVAYGTWFLQQKARDPQLAKRVQDKLAETLPAAAGVLVPPGYQLGDDYEYLGYSSQEMNEFAFTALSRRLKVIGIALPAVAA